MKVCPKYFAFCKVRGGSRAAATSKMERLVIIVNGLGAFAVIIAEDLFSHELLV